MDNLITQLVTGVYQEGNIISTFILLLQDFVQNLIQISPEYLEGAFDHPLVT